jgi:hypothetical protein
MVHRLLPKTTEDLIRWYERYASPFSLLVGFTIDAIAVGALDIWIYSLVLLLHLVLAATGIICLHLIERGTIRTRFSMSAAPLLPVVIQYSFGALFSGFILLYSQSAAFATSWVFVVLLACLLLGNERFRRFYATFPVQIGILYFALFSFLIFFVPVVTHEIGSWIFLASGLLSLAAIAAVLSFAASLMRSFFKEQRETVLHVVIGIFACINALYFLGAVPPLPLALRDAGVFHSLAKAGGGYEVSYEPRAWYEFYRRYAPVFHRVRGETVYVYTAIFAPTGIATKVRHEWQYFDEARDEWVTESTYEFPIVGGRDGGYRGYTLKRDIAPGTWRVNVETDYGQLIGRVAFTVEATATTPILERGVR